MQFDRINLEPRTMMGIREIVAMADLTAFYERSFLRIVAALAEQGLAPAGPATAVYHGMPTSTVDVTAGFPVTGPAVAPDGLVLSTSPDGAAVTTVYVGPYDGMTRTYDEIATWMQANNLTPRTEMWEEFLTGAQTDPNPATWQTRIVFPLV